MKRSAIHTHHEHMRYSYDVSIVFTMAETSLARDEEKWGENARRADEANLPSPISGRGYSISLCCAYATYFANQKCFRKILSSSFNRSIFSKSSNASATPGRLIPKS